MAVRRSKNPVVNRAFSNARLNALLARPAAALMDTPKLHLMKTVTALTPDTAFGALTEADFTGYAAVTPMAFAGPVADTPQVDALLASGTFIAGSPVVTTNTVTGYYITDGGGTTWYQAEIFEEPVIFVNPLDFLTLEVVIGEPVQIQV